MILQNQNTHLSWSIEAYRINRLQFDFFINIVKKKKRFSKWLKPTELSDLDVVKEYYGYSNEKAKSVLSLFTNEQLTELKKRICKGGKQ